MKSYIHNMYHKLDHEYNMLSRKRRLSRSETEQSKDNIVMPVNGPVHMNFINSPRCNCEQTFIY